jgi:hypothetical protein
MKTPAAIVMAALIVAAVLVWHRLTAPAVPVVDPSAIEVLMKRTDNLRIVLDEIIGDLNGMITVSNQWDSTWGLPERKTLTAQENADQMSKAWTQMQTMDKERERPQVAE